MTLRQSVAPLVARTIAAAALLTAAPSAFAAAFTSPLPPRDMLLIGSIGLLLVAVVVRVARHRTRPELMPPGPDLRWWKNS
jgi:hypothetical protein